LRAAVLPLGHQLSTLEDSDVLLHGGKRHSVSRCQLADGRVGVHHARQNVAPRGIGQGPEQMVEVIGCCLSIYNHMVVHPSMDAIDRTPRHGNFYRQAVRSGGRAACVSVTE
jgi:hypothetical protein